MTLRITGAKSLLFQYIYWGFGADDKTANFLKKLNDEEPYAYIVQAFFLKLSHFLVTEMDVLQTSSVANIP